MITNVSLANEIHQVNSEELSLPKSHNSPNIDSYKRKPSTISADELRRYKSYRNCQYSTWVYLGNKA